MKIPSFLLFVAAAKAASVPSLTLNNYDELTDGKTIFLKFFSPDCRYCRDIASDWEHLSDDWKDNEVGFVAEIDCSGAGRDLCEANDITYLPTLKWGDPAAPEEYAQDADRTYATLSDFAKEHLKPVCSASNLDVCDPEKREKLKEYLDLSLKDLRAAIQAEEAKMSQAEEAFSKAVEKLQSEYELLAEKREQEITEIKQAGLTMMKSAAQSKAKASVKEEL